MMTQRRVSRQIHVGDVPVGGDAPVAVQSMTKTDTRDAEATIMQIYEVAAAGCDIIRCAVPNMDAAKALKEICSRAPIPVIADIHFPSPARARGNQERRQRHPPEPRQHP